MTSTLIGWSASLILLLTLGAQTWKQYRSRSNTGVSRWLYVGELVASSLFVVYSARLHDSVFVVANCGGVVTALVGLVLYARNQRRRSSSAKAGSVATVSASAIHNAPPTPPTRQPSRPVSAATVPPASRKLPMSSRRRRA